MKDDTIYWFKNAVELAKPFHNPSLLLRNKQHNSVERQARPKANGIVSN